MKPVQHGWRGGATRIEAGRCAAELPNRPARCFTVRNLRVAARAAAIVHRYVAALGAMTTAGAVGLALLCVLSTGHSAAAAYQSEAALIVKIGKFVHWPA